MIGITIEMLDFDCLHRQFQTRLSQVVIFYGPLDSNSAKILKSPEKFEVYLARGHRFLGVLLGHLYELHFALGAITVCLLFLNLLTLKLKLLSLNAEIDAMMIQLKFALLHLKTESACFICL